MNDIKDISVVVCTWNGARFLAEQLDSILGQSYPVREIIVQDDGSTDGTWQILEEYSSRYPLMSIWHNEEKHGVNGNFFSAMRKAKGDFIAISDQDDIWERDKLKIQAETIGTKMMSSGFSVPFSTDGYPIAVDMRIPNTNLLRHMYLSELPGHSLLMKREILDFLPYGENMERFYDWQLVCVAAAAESIEFVPKTLVHFRRHFNAATATKPVGRSLVSTGAMSYLWFCVAYHEALQDEVEKRFRGILPFLEKLPFNTKFLEEAKEMSRLQIERGPCAFLNRTFFFVMHSRWLFHTEQTKPVVRFVRGLFFVFTCGYYYRSHIIKN